MMETAAYSELSEFGIILLFILGGAIFVLVTLGLAKIIRPSRPNEEKLAAYECGEIAEGNAWGQFNPRFYVIALIFLLFEVEMVFLFPWGTVFGNAQLNNETGGLWAAFAIAEAFIFVGILALGLVYAWKKGFLDWVKPEQRLSDYNSPVPDSLYEKVNAKYSSTNKAIKD